jgi:hypothetical protein
MILFGSSAQHTGAENTRGPKPTLFELFSDFSRKLKAGVLAHFDSWLPYHAPGNSKAGVLAHFDSLSQDIGKRVM